MNRLETLKIFCTVAETLHFRESAHRLAVSPQVVSRAITELEQTLGEVLFQRSTRQVKLTEFGEQFLPQAQQLVADALFANAKIPIRKQEIAGLVRVAVPEMYLMDEVLKALWAKAADYPDLRINWHRDLTIADVVDDQIDVGIRFGTPDDSRLIVKPVGETEECVVASPRLLAQTGTPESWQALQKGYPLSAIFNPNTGRNYAWYLSNEYQFMPQSPRFTGNHVNDDLASALAGNTIALVARFLCKPYLARGKLVELFPELPRKQWTAYVYRPQRSVTHPRVKLVFDWLAEILAEKLGEKVV
ncbi:LysR family transcriptional regulator [Aggregatibacter actinomycetemcomitans]|nr:LysR family transcriptional regulator [Aggregatibacter actinomycetemcomitans]